ncbi:MAG: hypothetical protein OEZ20_06710 [candidate division WOR-3 bacterium]|nr:hypothetical protein [candidate division WOR-3 bacterium]
MIRNLILFLLTVFSLSSAQMGWRPEPGRMFSFGLLAVLYIILASFLFSIIFWAVYLFLVKGKERKEKKEQSSN